MESRQTDAPVTRQWARLRGMRKASDIDGLLSELANPQEECEQTWGKTSHFTVRERAVHELQKLGAARAVQPIARLLTDSVPTVRANAAIALGKLGDDQVGQSLIAALEDSDDSVRHCAARSLGQLGFRPAVPSLISGLEDASVWIRLSAAKALARIGDRTAAKPIRMAIREQGWQHPILRLRLQKALLMLRLKVLRDR